MIGKIKSFLGSLFKRIEYTTIDNDVYGLKVNDLVRYQPNKVFRNSNLDRDSEFRTDTDDINSKEESDDLFRAFDSIGNKTLKIVDIKNSGDRDTTTYMCMDLSNHSIFSIPLLRDELRRVYSNVKFRSMTHLLDLERWMYKKLKQLGRHSYSVRVLSNKEINDFLIRNGLNIGLSMHKEELVEFDRVTQPDFNDYRYYIVVYEYRNIVGLISVGQNINEYTEDSIFLLKEIDSNYRTLDSVITVNIISGTNIDLLDVLIKAVMSYWRINSSGVSYIIVPCKLDAFIDKLEDLLLYINTDTKKRIFYSIISNKANE